MFASTQTSANDTVIPSPQVPVNEKRYKPLLTDSGNGRGAQIDFARERLEIYECIAKKMENKEPLTHDEQLFYSAFRKHRINGSGNGRGTQIYFNGKPVFFEPSTPELEGDPVVLDPKEMREIAGLNKQVLNMLYSDAQKRIDGGTYTSFDLGLSVACYMELGKHEERVKKYDFDAAPVTEEEIRQLGELPERDKADLFAYASGRAERFWKDIYEMFKDGYNVKNDFPVPTTQAPEDSLPALVVECLPAAPSSDVPTVSNLTENLFSNEQKRPTLWGMAKKIFNPVKVCATVGIAAMALSGLMAYKSLQPSRYSLPPVSAPQLAQTKTTISLPEIYTARKGDSLWRIAGKKAKTTHETNSMVNSIARYNGINREGILRIGQTIVLPPDLHETGIVNENAYIVKRGDTLSGIALSQCGTVAAAKEIAKHDNIKNLNVIYAGSKLYIPPCSAGIKSQKLTPKRSASNRGSYGNTFARVASAYIIESDADLIRTYNMKDVSASKMARKSGLNTNDVYEALAHAKLSPYTEGMTYKWNRRLAEKTGELSAIEDMIKRGRGSGLSASRIASQIEADIGYKISESTVYRMAKGLQK